MTNSTLRAAKMLTRQIVDTVYYYEPKVLPTGSYIKMLLMGEDDSRNADWTKYPPGWSMYKAYLQPLLDFLSTGKFKLRIPTDSEARETWNAEISLAIDYLGLPFHAKVLDYPEEYLRLRFEHQWYQAYSSLCSREVDTMIVELNSSDYEFLQSCLWESKRRLAPHRPQTIQEQLGRYASRVHFKPKACRKLLNQNRSLNYQIKSFEDLLRQSLFQANVSVLQAAYFAITNETELFNVDDDIYSEDYSDQREQLESQLLHAFNEAGMVIRSPDILKTLSLGDTDDHILLNVHFCEISTERAEMLTSWLIKCHIMGTEMSELREEEPFPASVAYDSTKLMFVSCLYEGGHVHVQINPLIYNSIESLLMSFSIDLDTIAYVKSKFVLTSLARYCLPNRLVVMDYARFNDTYVKNAGELMVEMYTNLYTPLLTDVEAFENLSHPIAQILNFAHENYFSVRGLSTLSESLFDELDKIRFFCHPVSAHKEGKLLSVSIAEPEAWHMLTLEN